ncbi:MAG: hypothetical protein KJP00_09255 [Bacteroidia bacterium]|nr:hypothetical protein [Bacteroidia bacterium]
MKEEHSGVLLSRCESCGIEEGFEETMSAYMSTIAYRLGKIVGWDAENRRITNVDQAELESIGIAW